MHADLDACHDNRRENERELSAQVATRRSVPTARAVPTVEAEPVVETPKESKAARRRRRKRATPVDLSTHVEASA
jgi:hypothetical protein